MNARAENPVYRAVAIASCALAVLFTVTLGTLAVAAPAIADEGQVEMYRLYNIWSGEHFYTADASERDGLVRAGWTDEGVGWIAPVSGDDVYRVYNPYSGDHHYTLDVEERDGLVAAGWTDEGIGWRSDVDKRVPLYREYNPNMSACNHNYTADVDEHNGLVWAGWHDEGVGWYGAAPAVRESGDENSGSAQNAGTFEAEYQEGVFIVPTDKAIVSEDGKTATIAGDALKMPPREGFIAFITDDHMDGTLIKIETVTANENGSYTVTGSLPEFGEVYKSLRMSGSFDLGKIEYKH